MLTFIMRLKMRSILDTIMHLKFNTNHQLGALCEIIEEEFR
jgi:hypothetical protein